MALISNSGERIQVLQIVGNAIVGGMESYVAQLTRDLPRERFGIVCLCPFESPFTEELRKNVADVYIAPIGDDELEWETLQLAAMLVRVHGIHIIHAHLPNAHQLASAVASITDV